MKNQYFGDINDYRKYGLLRAILDSTQLQILVAWMLTPDDGSSDGKHTTYLEVPEQWRHYDVELFDGLKALVNDEYPRDVDLIEKTDLLPNATYHSYIVQDLDHDREEWFRSLQRSVANSEIVFLDPDNGLEVKSKPYGRRNSCKYIYWKEVQAIWKTGNSMLIYQHFPRKKRSQFIQQILESLHTNTPGSVVEAFSTANVAFLLALQSRHHCHYEPITMAVQERWGSQIVPWSNADTRQSVAADS